jgi:hypothetical protein
MKIYFITNLMILILFHEFSTFLYNFSQSIDCLTPWDMRIAFFYGWREYSVVLGLAPKHYQKNVNVANKMNTMSIPKFSL